VVNELVVTPKASTAGVSMVVVVVIVVYSCAKPNIISIIVVVFWDAVFMVVSWWGRMGCVAMQSAVMRCTYCRK